MLSDGGMPPSMIRGVPMLGNAQAGGNGSRVTPQQQQQLQQLEQQSQQRAGLAAREPWYYGSGGGASGSRP